MAYRLKVWDYENQKDIDKVVSHFKQFKRMVVIIDEDNDKSFIIVGDGKDKKMEIEQGRAILDLVNVDGFPDKMGAGGVHQGDKWPPETVTREQLIDLIIKMR